ncbi:MAG: DUF5752 family protein [Nanoarchaeota archaeon]
MNDDTFYFKNGRQARSVDDLLQVVESMNDEDYSHHVNEFKNDFATWIRHTHGDGQLADEVAECMGRDDAINALRRAVILDEARRSTGAQQSGQDEKSEQVSPVQVSAPMYPRAQVDEEPTQAEEAAEDVGPHMETKQMASQTIKRVEPTTIQLDSQPRQTLKQAEKPKAVHKEFSAGEFYTAIAISLVLGFVVAALLFMTVLSGWIVGRSG